MKRDETSSLPSESRHPARGEAFRRKHVLREAPEVPEGSNFFPSFGKTDLFQKGYARLEELEVTIMVDAGDGNLRSRVLELCCAMFRKDVGGCALPSGGRPSFRRKVDKLGYLRTLPKAGCPTWWPRTRFFEGIMSLYEIRLRPQVTKGYHLHNETYVAALVAFT